MRVDTQYNRNLQQIFKAFEYLLFFYAFLKFCAIIAFKIYAYFE